MPESVWICHQCGQQVIPHNLDGFRVCSRCSSDFLEEIDVPSDEEQQLPADLLRSMHEYGISDDDDHDDPLRLPGAFPPGEPTASGSRTPPVQRQRTQTPLFRMGVRGGTLTFGGGGGTPTDGRRAGRGAGFASSEPLLRTSHQEGVPTLSEFIAGLGANAQARAPPRQTDPLQALFGPGGSRHPSYGGTQVNIGDVLGGLLGAFAAGGSSRAGNDDPYLAMLRAQGGLGAFLGGGMMRGGQFGDFATSQEAFDHIVTNLAQAAGSEGNRPPPASNERINELPLVPISSVLLEGMDPKECPICMSDFELGESLRKMPCTHAFHDHCLRTWLQTNGTCPVCRYSLVEDRSAEAGPSSRATGAAAGGVGSPPSTPSRQTAADPRSSSEGPSVIGAGGAVGEDERREPPVRRSGAAAGTGVRAEEGA